MPTNSRSKTSGAGGGADSERPGGARKAGNGSVDTAGNGGATSPGILGGIKQNVTSRVDEQKNRAADGLGGIANVIRNAGNELRNDNEALASYIDTASDQLRRFADHIRQKGVADMMDDVQSFARRRPALFIGGAFLIGIGLARFLKSSAERDAYELNESFSDVDPMTTQSVPSYGTRTGFGEAGSY
jgi:hypothetical protein